MKLITILDACSRTISTMTNTGMVIYYHRSMPVKRRNLVQYYSLHYDILYGSGATWRPTSRLHVP